MPFQHHNRTLATILSILFRHLLPHNRLLSILSHLQYRKAHPTSVQWSLPKVFYLFPSPRPLLYWTYLSLHQPLFSLHENVSAFCNDYTPQPTTLSLLFLVQSHIDPNTFLSDLEFSGYNHPRPLHSFCDSALATSDSTMPHNRSKPHLIPTLNEQDILLVFLLYRKIYNMLSVFYHSSS